MHSESTPSEQKVAWFSDVGASLLPCLSKFNFGGSFQWRNCKQSLSTCWLLGAFGRPSACYTGEELSSFVLHFSGSLNALLLPLCFICLGDVNSAVSCPCVSLCEKVKKTKCAFFKTNASVKFFPIKEN